LPDLAQNKENYYLCRRITSKTINAMEQQTDIRWLQRYSNFHKACQRLIEVTESGTTIENLSELEQEGLVQRFEYTFELSWKVMQDLLIYKGYEFMLGPNGTLKMAFEDGLISDHDGWRQMTKSRNMLSHVYDEEETDAVVRLIFSRYAPLLKSLDKKLEQLSQDKEYQQS
jgi:nucleotidyltransferase substrate binding protein (TIGR01987 family)